MAIDLSGHRSSGIMALADARARRCLSGAESTRVFTEFEYLLLERVRAWGLAGTELASATVGTVRLKLLKVAALVRVSVRRVSVRLSSAYPWQGIFRLCHRRLMALAAASG